MVAKAASFEVVAPDPTSRASIAIAGKIDLDDGVRFAHLLDDLRRKKQLVREIALDSMGGYIHESLAIAALVSHYRLNTHVRGVCASSCFNVFAAGASRSASRTASIGVHMAFTADGTSRAGTDAMANHAIRKGVPRRVIAKMRATPAPGMAWLDSADLDAMHVTLTP